MYRFCTCAFVWTRDGAPRRASLFRPPPYRLPKSVYSNDPSHTTVPSRSKRVYWFYASNRRRSPYTARRRRVAFRPGPTGIFFALFFDVFFPRQGIFVEKKTISVCWYFRRAFKLEYETLSRSRHANWTYAGSYGKYDRPVVSNMLWLTLVE